MIDRELSGAEICQIVAAVHGVCFACVVYSLVNVTILMIVY